MSSEMSSRGPRLEASLILFASKECSDRARSFRKGKSDAAAGLHAQLDAAAAVHATRVGGWQAAHSISQHR